ncbi:ABC-F family ATP-binding cassette domain-containing protein [Virgisporangium aurantiacum]|uniref:ABC transporter ATP-binding protein n=1 Tax=Virgisporangium aurantiacum TaxID=175570 RepID=A0A8J3Z9N1_9ACTN|nr:ABC-F family ATP-binding cassette domain-containing protein [Virgisporangium aurantiacum]GIJ59939.1 ABC transporter ATP-binding protein [Virgisporangium aurantiacum]
MSGQIMLRNVSVGFGARRVLSGVTLTVATGDRIGIVAPNGVGKSTLLKVLAGDLVPESGEVIRAPATATVLRLAQEPVIEGAESLRDHLARRTYVAQAQQRMDAAAEALAAQRPEGHDYGAALDDWLALGGADFDERAATVIADLGLPDDLLHRGAAALSGGQKARLALAAVLLAQPDLLLLDEPTNDLDDDGLGRLEERVLAIPAGLVVVSHDRAFLATAVQTVVEIDEFTGQVAEYGGGWDAYVAEREAGRNRAVEARAGYEAERANLVDRARQKREWARSGAQRAARNATDPDKHVRHHHIQGAQRSGAGAAKADRAIERLDADAPDDVREPWKLQLSIGVAARPGAVVVDLKAAVVTRGSVTLGPFDLTVGWAERIRLAGPNGSGKTTLVDAIMGREPLRAGTRYAGPSVVFGELDQSRRIFATEEPVVDVVRGAAPDLDVADARTLLAKFRLAGDAALRPAARLSPGERTRAALALLQARGVNALILDEPTNHLDLEAIEQLESALADYPGTLIIVTHDRRLAEAVKVDRVVDIRTLYPSGKADSRS